MVAASTPCVSSRRRRRLQPANLFPVRRSSGWADLGGGRRFLSSAARRERMLRLPRGAPVFEISTLFYLITPAAL